MVLTGPRAAAERPAHPQGEPARPVSGVSLRAPGEPTLGSGPACGARASWGLPGARLGVLGHAHIGGWAGSPARLGRSGPVLDRARATSIAHARICS
jgi:hypothetical protein